MRNSIIALLAVQLILQLPLFYFAAKPWHKYIRLVTFVVLFCLTFFVVPQILEHEYVKSLPVERGVGIKCGMPLLAMQLRFLVVYGLSFIMVQLGIVEVFRLIMLRFKEKKNEQPH
jgi:hypothetical protein